jgi:hypothetical protein
MRAKCVLTAVVLCLALAGCGGDDDKTTASTSSTPATAPTTTTDFTPAPTTTDDAPDADYKAQVEKAAKRFKRETESAMATLRDASNADEFGAGADEFTAAVETFNGKLRSLTPPDRAAEPQEKLIDELDAFSDDVNAVRSALDRGDTQEIRRLGSRIRSDVADITSAAQALQAAVD